MQVDDKIAIEGQPPVVSAEEWQQALDELLTAEKEATRTLDALAARRRRLPMVKFDNGYAFDTPTGRKTLIDLFDGREQLVTYQFMDNGPDDYCPGCTNFTANVPVGGLSGLADRGVIDHPASGHARGSPARPAVRPG